MAAQRPGLTQALGLKKHVAGTNITILMVAGLVPALLLFKRYPRRLGRFWEPVVNLLAALGALLPVALTKLDLVQWPLGIYAIAYFILYFTGLLVFKWRQERLSRHKELA